MKPRWSVPFTCALGLLAFSCNVVPPAQSDPTRTFILEEGTAAPVPSVAEGAVRIGLHRVAIAGYLKGRSIVIRSGTNEVRPQDLARWGEPLESAIERLLRARIGSSPSVARVLPEPFPLDADRDFDVSVTVDRCEGGSFGGKPAALFEARVEILPANGPAKALVRKVFTAPPAPWDGKDFGRLAALLSEAVDGLAREIVASLPKPAA